MKGFKPPHKNAARKIKLAKTKGTRVDPATSLPKGLGLPERSKKKSKQLERYANICAREEAAKLKAFIASQPDAKMA